MLTYLILPALLLLAVSAWGVCAGGYKIKCDEHSHTYGIRSDYETDREKQREEACSTLKAKKESKEEKETIKQKES